MDSKHTSDFQFEEVTFNGEQPTIPEKLQAWETYILKNSFKEAFLKVLMKTRFEISLSKKAQLRLATSMRFANEITFPHKIITLTCSISILQKKQWHKLEQKIAVIVFHIESYT